MRQATLNFVAVATLLFVFFCECPKFCDLAKQRRKILGGVSEVGKDDFSLYYFWRCVVFLVFFFFCCDRATQSLPLLVVRRHIVGLGALLLPVDMGREGPLPGGAVPEGPTAPGQDLRPVAAGVAMQDGLVARRLQHQCPPLLGSGGGCATTCVPDTGALAERGVPRLGRIALRPLYATRDLRRAVVVDKTLPAVRQ